MEWIDMFKDKNKNTIILRDLAKEGTMIHLGNKKVSFLINLALTKISQNKRKELIDIFFRDDEVIAALDSNYICFEEFIADILQKDMSIEEAITIGEIFINNGIMPSEDYSLFGEIVEKLSEYTGYSGKIEARRQYIIHKMYLLFEDSIKYEHDISNIKYDFYNIGDDFDKLLFNKLIDSDDAFDLLFIAGLKDYNKLLNTKELLNKIENCSNSANIILECLGAINNLELGYRQFTFNTILDNERNSKKGKVLTRGAHNLIKYIKETQHQITFSIDTEEDATNTIEFLEYRYIQYDKEWLRFITKTDKNNIFVQVYIRKQINSFDKMNIVEKRKKYKLVENILLVLCNNQDSATIAIKECIDYLIKKQIGYCDARNHIVIKLMKKLLSYADEEAKLNVIQYINSINTKQKDIKISKEIIKNTINKSIA